MKTKLFLSNSEIVNLGFLKFCESSNIELISKSLIDFRAIPFDTEVKTDVVFFASPRSVEFFFAEKGHTSGVFACVGEGTAKRLNKLGYQADFVGVNSGNPEDVAKDFRVWLGNRTVLFPLSSSSNKTISSHVPKTQLQELVIYETVALPEVIEECDIYVFTSPSNVVSFLECNSLPPNAKIIAWGQTTERKLLSLNVNVDLTLRSSSLEELRAFLDRRF